MHEGTKGIGNEESGEPASSTKKGQNCGGDRIRADTQCRYDV